MKGPGTLIPKPLLHSFLWVRNIETLRRLPHMAEAGGGAIVNIASVHGLLAVRRRVVYDTGKAAVIGLTRQLAVDFGPLGIRVNAICPGLIITERIFEYKGMGDFFLTAYGNGDFPQMMPWLVIVVIAVIMFNLLADVLYAFLDPRIRLD